jgi:hypothetical protein
VLAVIVALTAGWPLVSAMVSGNRPLAPGTTVTVGPSAADSGRVTVGRGWSVLTANTNPRQFYSLGHGALRLSVRYVSPIKLARPGELWQGLRQMMRVANPGVSPGRLQVITTRAGDRGLTAALSGHGQTGRAAVFPAPARRFAIEMIMIGPPSTARTIRTAGLPILESLHFPAAAR